VVKTCALPVLAAFQLAFLSATAFADETQIVDLSSDHEAATIMVLNDSDTGLFDFSGGVGSGPDLSGNGSMVQVVQPITAGSSNMPGNGQINYRFIPTPPATSASGH
jgi:hypothetical protein